MGNCIGKKSGTQSKQQRQSSSATISTAKLLFNRTQTQPSSLEQINILIASLSDVDGSVILLNNDAKSKEEEATEFLSSLSITTNDQYVFIHTPTTSSPVQLSTQCKKFKTSNTVIELSENSLTHPIVLITNEKNLTMGPIFSKETDQEVPACSSDLFSKSVDSSISESSFSSSSCHTTPFSSQDQLILCSSSSSANSQPIQSSNQKRCHSSSYSETIYSNEIFTPILPVIFSRCHNDSILHDFHQNLISYKCQTLSSIIDDIVQQQFIRIHRRTKTLLIEHKQFECVQLNEINKFDTPSFIFDHNQKFVYITKYARWHGLQSIACTTKDVLRTFSSCDHCLSLLSGSKLMNYLRPFFLVNATYNLVQMCFNEMNNNNTFGYISQIKPNHIRQTIINNSKLTYSCDLDVDHMSFCFVLRVRSWPQEIRSTFEQRKRLWPLNVEKLFTNTCFIRYDGIEQETSTTDQCHSCEKLLSSVANSTWSYTYTAIENQLIQVMSDGHRRFASIIWNYLNGKTQEKLPFLIFKHTLFYFFEQYSPDAFKTSELLTYIHLFTDFLLNRIKTKTIPHYFNTNCNLYHDDISINFTSMEITYLDLKNCSVYLLPKTSLYLYHLFYLIQFQSNFLHYLRSAKTNLIQTILETHEMVIKQLSLGVKTYKRQLDSTIAIKSHRPLTLDCLYQYQEENVQIILDYLPLLREKEPSLLIHSLWSIFIQYFNSLFDDLFIS